MKNTIHALNEKIIALEAKNVELLKKNEEQDSTIAAYKRVLTTVFTPGQIKKLLNTNKNATVRWSSKDITSAISLRSVSPKAYRYLRANNYPLPCLSTLRSWVSNFELNQGILKNVIHLMNKKSIYLNERERLCVISFDEVYLSNKIDIDKKCEVVLGPHKTCQTVMVRGLVANWKQPIYYQFDQPITEEILENIIAELYSAKYIVVGVVSDMGIGNMKLWSKLNVGIDDTKSNFFKHPVDTSLKIFVYADVPHLLKLARNHLLDHGFNIGADVINADYWENLLNISSTELTFAHKLTEQHLNLKGSMRQRVRPAAQIFSNSIAKAMEYCGNNGLMPRNSNWKKASEIVQLFNDWFDLFNARTKLVQNNPKKNAFGTDLDNQKKILKQMSDTINSIRVGKHKNLIPFQKGILLSNSSLADMYDYLHEKYNIEYILTSRLNQDVLENFFAYIRGMGGPNDHPSPLEFKYRLRWYILGKNSSAIFTENRNTLESSESCLINVLEELSTDKCEKKEICLTQQMLACLSDEKEIDNVQSEEEMIMQHSFVMPQYLEEEVPQLIKDLKVKEKVTQESLIYIAGFVAHKFKNKYCLGIPTNQLDTRKAPDWLQFISRGLLLHPNDALLEAAQKMETEFSDMHGDTLSKEKHIIHSLAERTIARLEKSKAIPLEVILCLSRTRTYIRLRDLNRKISFQNCQRKLNQKMSKMTNYKK